VLIRERAFCGYRLLDGGKCSKYSAIGRRAIAFVVVRLPGRDSRPQRQERLSAVERLDLALLVDAEH
jgi:hypothetical protein